LRTQKAKIKKPSKSNALIGVVMANEHTYSVLLSRVDPKAGPKASFKVEVKAPDADAAKHTAEARFPGYKAKSGASRVVGS
jgi:hypothetical protein